MNSIAAMIHRGWFCLALTLSAGLGAVHASPAKIESQWQPDQGDGTFRNPILAGHWHDPTVLRVNADYYMTHCEHDSRGPIIWHSRDLVNWRPLVRIESLAGLGNIWATDFIHHDGTYYLYAPLMLPNGPDGRLRFSNYVVTAKHPQGPWSQPVDLGFGGIDPGHVVDRDGRRYIYVNEGKVVPLSPDGLRATGELTKVYDGWPIPKDWVVECECLESPKLFWRGEYCYMVSAMGGTAGPSTSHLIVVARARSALGPWENSPHNPMLRTSRRDEPWWSQGHGTLIDATDGSWWVMYHAIQNGRRSLGRNTLLLPVTWTDDGWPVIPEGINPQDTLRKPPGENVGHGMALSDDFASSDVGIQWDPLEPVPDFASRYVSGGGLLRMQAKGVSVADAARLTVLPANRSFEVQVCLEVPTGAEAGLTILSGDTAGPGLALHGDGKLYHPRRGKPQAPGNFAGQRVWLKIRNLDHDVSLYHSTDGRNWEKFAWGASLSSEATARVALYAFGEGEARFHSFRYRGLP
ncbi:xylosidase [Oleiharenicola lentus]|uniref:Xylosidase n=1 Tax=Oleiharenicola lentus TaxID=2508720 RepID=A0A4Q1CBN2_9BACT|nr:family 43 glycosylhydrolase [Oleiharenicola lentus]RXK56326.1 xylosidase [Oleiharenicola lentus]